jgi:hypothetical protein
MTGGRRGIRLRRGRGTVHPAFDVAVILSLLLLMTTFAFWAARGEGWDQPRISSKPLDTRLVYFPFGEVRLSFLLLLTIPLPVIRAIIWIDGVEGRYRRNRQRWRAYDKCPVCKYDLRATPYHCPECGWHDPHFVRR